MGVPSGLDALTFDDGGNAVEPEGDGAWSDWVAATATRAWALDDPLLDWLDLHGRDHGFVPDTERDHHDVRTDFGAFITRKGRKFEVAVIDHLAFCGVEIMRVDAGRGGARDLDAARATVELMGQGAPAIHQAVLRDPEARMYGAADLLVRSDVLHRLFPDSVTAADAATPAPALAGGSWHYRVIDVKFTTLDLRAQADELASDGWEYQMQVFAYNRALGRIQEFLPDAAYLLGRGWRRTLKGQRLRGTSCMERLGAVPVSAARRAGSLADDVATAAAWVRTVREEGDRWDALPEPSDDRLRPNMSNQRDQPWSQAKRQIAAETGELTRIAYVSPAGRRSALDAGVTSWTDPRATAAAIGLTGDRARIVDAILDTNRDVDGPVVRPQRIMANRQAWESAGDLEFYVDFETVSDLDDDFTAMPDKGGQPLIFMIGCGHIDDGQWQFECFIADALDEASESRVIADWIDHMSAVRDHMGAETSPIVYHWSAAEVSSLDSAYNAARQRHPDANWPDVNWFDFYRQVALAEPVTVRGAMGFGLKAMAKALHAHGLIGTVWDDGPADGLGAMVGAWWAAHTALEQGCSLREIDLMREIARYNEVDCRTMWELIEVLRRDH